MVAIQCAREATTLAQAAGDISSTILYLNRTAYSLLLRGKLHEAVQVTEQATLLGTTPVGLQHAMVCWGSIFHADVLREWNRLDEALDLVLQAVRLSEQTETVVALYLQRRDKSLSHQSRLACFNWHLATVAKPPMRILGCHCK